MACCGKKRAAEKLARTQGQVPAPLSLAPKLTPQPLVRPVKPRPIAPNPAPMSLHLAPGSRQMAAPPESPAPNPVIAPPEASQLESFVDVEFQYTGTGRLTVTGPISGKVYCFTQTGETVSVHGTDANSLVLVPGLKIVT